MIGQIVVSENSSLLKPKAALLSNESRHQGHQAGKDRCKKNEGRSILYRTNSTKKSGGRAAWPEGVSWIADLEAQGAVVMG